MSHPSLNRTLLITVAAAGAVIWLLATHTAGNPQPVPNSAVQTGSVLQALPSTSAAGHGYPLNAHGQSYGSSGDAQIHGGEPDLILVVATNGNQGYVKRADFDSPLPRNPEEAVAMMSARTGKRRTVPVYDLEGETVIGEFVFG